MGSHTIDSLRLQSTLGTVQSIVLWGRERERKKEMKGYSKITTEMAKTGVAVTAAVATYRAEKMPTKLSKQQNSDRICTRIGVNVQQC